MTSSSWRVLADPANHGRGREGPLLHIHLRRDEGDFLVCTDGKGVLHVHLDACHSCYKYKRGFVVEEPELVCIACRLTYRIEDEVWDYIGACAPIAIRSSIEGDNLAIQRHHLERSARYF